MGIEKNIIDNRNFYEIRINLERLRKKLDEIPEGDIQRQELNKFLEKLGVKIPTFFDRSLAYPFCPMEKDGWGITIDLENGDFGLKEGVLPLPSKMVSVRLEKSEFAICDSECQNSDVIICFRYLGNLTNLNTKYPRFKHIQNSIIQILEYHLSRGYV